MLFKKQDFINPEYSENLNSDDPSKQWIFSLVESDHFSFSASIYIAIYSGQPRTSFKMRISDNDDVYNKSVRGSYDMGNAWDKHRKNDMDISWIYKKIIDDYDECLKKLINHINNEIQNDLLPDIFEFLFNPGEDDFTGGRIKRDYSNHDDENPFMRVHWFDKNEKPSEA